MKKFFILILGVAPIIGFAQKEKSTAYQLNAEVNFPEYDQTGRSIYFVYVKDGRSIIDSSIITNNKCSFSGVADINIRASLQFTKPNSTPEPALDPNTITFYLNAGLTSIKATGNLSKALISGSSLQDEYALFKKKYSSLERGLTMLGRRKRSLKETDSLQIKIITNSIDSIQNNKVNGLFDFLNQNIEKPYAAEAIIMCLRANLPSLDIDKVQTYFNQLPANQKQAPDGLEILKLLADYKKNKKD